MHVHFNIYLLNRSLSADSISTIPTSTFSGLPLLTVLYALFDNFDFLATGNLLDTTRDLSANPSIFMLSDLFNNNSLLSNLLVLILFLRKILTFLNHINKLKT